MKPNEIMMYICLILFGMWWGSYNVKHNYFTIIQEIVLLLLGCAVIYSIFM